MEPRQDAIDTSGGKGNEEAAVRHRAAAEIVRSAIKVVELAELQRRLEELEQRIGGES